MAELTSNKASSSSNKGRKSSLSSSSPLVFRKTHQPSPSHIPLPPCIWDVEYPRCQQQLRRSVSLSGWSTRASSRGVKPTYNLSTSSSVRSLWRAENKEYLEMRFGLLLQPEKEKPDVEKRNLKEQLEQDDQNYRLQHHDTSEESSIFSNPDYSSFSSGNSEDFSSARDEPVSFLAPTKVQEDEQDEFLEYRLEQGNLVDNPRAVTRTSEHPAKRHNVDSSRLESPRRKLCSTNRPKLTYDDRYPVWSGSSSSSNSTSSHWQLIKSSSTCSKLPDFPSVSSSASASSTEHRRNIGSLVSSPSPRLHFSPGRFRSSKISREDSVSVPASSEIHHMDSKLQSPHPEVHCKSFFLRRPGSFIRRRKKEESRPMQESDGYRVAHLHCGVQNDHHSYTFVMEGTDELLVARTPMVRRADEESEEQLVCSFYSEKRRATRSQSWKPNWVMSTSSASESTSEIVASMKLSRKLASEEQLDLEFALFDATGVVTGNQVGEEEPRLSFSSWDVRKSPQSSSHSVSSVSSSSVALNPSGLKRSWWSLMPGSPVLRRKSSKPAASPSRGVQAEEDVDVLKEIWKEMEAAESLRRTRAANRLQELAAIIVTVPNKDSSKTKTPNRSRSNSMDSLQLPNSASSRPMNLTVVLPVGQHGMPTECIPGPSPLIKRWRSGTCDCGGWDMGCQLQVLGASHNESLSKLLDVSLQGAGRERQSVFNLVGLSNGLFSVRFKDPLSPLQAFATAVSVLYRSPSAATVNRDSEQWSKALGLPNPLLHLERL